MVTEGWITAAEVGIIGSTAKSADVGRSACMSSIMIVAVIQHPPVFLNVQASIRLADELVAAAATKGANLINFDFDRQVNVSDAD
jgi:hypothetical protein